MEYLSDELQALTFADNYYSWILKEFRTSIGEIILGIGAGIGTFSSTVLYFLFKENLRLFQLGKIR